MTAQHNDAGAALIERIAAAQQLLDTQGLVDTLATLVRVPSVYDRSRADANERAVAEIIASLLDAWDMPYVRNDVWPNRPNLVADVRGQRSGAGPLLIFEGHTDVVTAGDLSAWTVDPFGGQRCGDRLYGRGACDMKGGLCAMLFAARALRAAGADFAGSLRLAVLADEEGLMGGAKQFVADGWLDGAAAAIICEPEGGRVCVAQKGAIRVRIRLFGKMAHGAMPDEGVNPIAALGEVITACRELERQIQSEQSPHPLLGMFHLTPTVALGGERDQVNVIPATAEVMLDIRTAPHHDHEAVRERVAATVARSVARVPHARHEVDVTDDRPATETDPDNAVVRAAIAAHAAEWDTSPPLGGVPGSTDGTIFWRATRLPVVTWGPGLTTLPHQADEYVDVSEVVRYARAYISAALRYFDEMERSLS